MVKNIIEVSPEKFHWVDPRRYTFALAAEKNGVVHLAGQTASAYDPKERHVVCKGDVVEQIKVALEKLGVVLEAAGLSFDNVVKTVDYINPQALAKYRQTAEVRRQYLGNGPVASTGICVDGLLRPDALIEVSAVAIAGAKRERLVPSDPRFERYKQLTYAPVVKTGNMLWLSGVIGSQRDAQGKQIAIKETAKEVDLCYETLDMMLKVAGATPADVVKSVDYVAPQAILQYHKSEKVRKSYYQGQYPAATGIVINRLLRPDAHVEIELVAVKDAPREEVRIPEWEGRYGRLTYVPAIKKGKLMFFSGQGAVDHTTGQSVAPFNVAAQARKCYENIARVMAEAGYSMDDIVNTIEFYPPNAMDGIKDIQEVRKEFFGTRFPAATGVLVHRLLRPELLVEVVAMAVV